MRFYAQPYAINATGFYFETAEEFAEKLAACRDDILHAAPLRAVKHPR